MADIDKETQLAKDGKAAFLAIVTLFEKMREVDDQIDRQVDIAVRAYD